MVDLVAANHTNRELELMLGGKKPLSMFYAEVSELPDEQLVPEQRFAPYVAKGQFVRAEKVLPGPFSPKLGRETKLKFVLFATPNEQWRIPAMLMLKEQHAKTGAWNDACERVECFLLGYSEEETNAWINRNSL